MDLMTHSKRLAPWRAKSHQTLALDCRPMRPFLIKPIKLEDSRLHGAHSGAELFVVEGDSAASAVTVLRQSEFQATLPMQGKPLNPLKSGAPKVHGFELYQRLSESLGVPLVDQMANGKGPVSAAPDRDTLDLETLRFSRVLLLFDPDADGIHIGALMLMFFWRWMRPLLASGRIEMVRAPRFEVRWCSPDGEVMEPAHAYSDTHLQAIQAELLKRQACEIQTQRFRGLGSINQTLLRQTCIDPATRKTQVMGLDDAQAAIDVFGARPLSFPES